MVAVTETTSVEEKFYADFKKICTEAKGDFSTILDKINSNVEPISFKDKNEMENNIRGYFLNSASHLHN